MTKEKLAYYGKLSKADYTALFVSQNLKVKEGLTPKLSKKAEFIRSMVMNNGRISMHKLNKFFADARKLDKRGYFKASDIIGFNDLATIQKLTVQGATCANAPDALRFLDADKNPLFIEVHRDKKTGELSVGLEKFDPALCSCTIIPKKEWEAKKNADEVKALNKLLEKHPEILAQLTTSVA